MKKTAKQNRKIWAMRGELGLEEESLRDIVEGITAQRRISALSFDEAQQVIESLEGLIAERRRQHRRVGPPSYLASKRQLRLIRDLSAQLGWGEWGLRRWLKAHFRIDHEIWLTPKRASDAITALKIIKAREKACA